MKTFALSLFLLSFVRCATDQKKTSDIDFVRKPEGKKPKVESEEAIRLKAFQNNLDLYSRIIKNQGEISEHDKTAINAIKPPIAPDSIEEALVTMLVLEENSTLVAQAEATATSNQAPSVEAEPQTSPEGQTPEPAATPEAQPNTHSVEKSAEEHGVDVIAALRTNPFLSNFYAKALAKKAIGATENSPLFEKEIRDTIVNAGHGWKELVSDMTEGQAMHTETKESEIAEDSAISVAETSPVQNPENTAAPTEVIDPTMTAEAALKLSQALLEEERYLEAITALRGIDNNSPLYASTLEKIKEISNTAVKNLRSKAAKSYQAAMPVADKKARMAYLVEARELLTRALKEFPGSDQTETLKKNLEVIAKNLELIEKDPDGGHP